MSGSQKGEKTTFPSNEVLLFLYFFATNKSRHVATAAYDDLLSQTRLCRSVAPFPLKVLRLSGTPESPPGLFGEEEKQGGLCFDDVRLRVSQSLRFGSVCPF